MAASQSKRSSATLLSRSSFSFTQGFLLGQLSIALLIGAFIKFFIFGDPPPADARANFRLRARETRLSSASHSSPSHRRTVSSSIAALRRKRSSVLRQPAQSLSPATILEKTYYNVSGHQPESLDWFNVLIAQTIAQLRADARQDDAVLGTLQSALNGQSRPEWLDEIRISEVALGEEFPIFSNCRIIPVDDGLGGVGDGHLNVPGQGGRGQVRIGEGTRLQARMDVDLSDVITLGIETRLVLNYPKPSSAVLPVALSVSVVRFSGTLSLSFVPSLSPSSSPINSSPAPTPTSAATPGSNEPTQKPNHPPTSLTFTFLPDYRLDLSVRSLLGSRARLTDVPKIAQLVEDRIQAWFDERVVEPRFQQIVLPSLWPRKKTARGPESGEEGGAEENGGGEGGEEEVALDEGMGIAEGEDEEPVRYSRDDDSLEARLWRDGRRLREDERLRHEAVHRHQRPKPRPPREAEEDGLRRRVPAYTDATRNSGAIRMMPGALPA